MNNLENFLKTLKYQKYSSGSIHNYKSDITQFITWTTSQDTTKSLRELLEDYEKILRRNYKASTVKRKYSSISTYLDYLEPNEKVSKISPSNFIKNQRSAFFLGAYSIALLSLVSVVIVTAKQGDNLTTQERDIDFEGKYVQVLSSSDFTKASDVKVAISAPDINQKIDSQFNEDYVFIKDYKESYSTNVSGKATIKAGEFNTTIYSDSIYSDSILQVTLTSRLDEGNIFVESLSDGFAVISVTQVSESNVNFNWTLSETILYKEVL